MPHQRVQERSNVSPASHLRSCISHQTCPFWKNSRNPCTDGCPRKTISSFTIGSVSAGYRKPRLCPVLLHEQDLEWDPQLTEFMLQAQAVATTLCRNNLDVHENHLSSCKIRLTIPLFFLAPVLQLPPFKAPVRHDPSHRTPGGFTLIPPSPRFLSCACNAVSPSWGPCSL